MHVLAPIPNSRQRFETFRGAKVCDSKFGVICFDFVVCLFVLTRAAICSLTTDKAAAVGR